MSQRRARITAVGTCVPEKVLTNADLAKIVDTSDEWIRSRTGIQRRHVVEPGTPTSDLVVPAAREALRRRGVEPEELDLIIVATVTPDMLFPATACIVQDKLGASRAWGFDGIEVVNEVVLNQVLVRVGDDDVADRVEHRIQDDGTCWLGATTWRGERLIRISVSNWSTTEADIDRCIDAIARASSGLHRTA